MTPPSSEQRPAPQRSPVEQLDTTRALNLAALNALEREELSHEQIKQLSSLSRSRLRMATTFSEDAIRASALDFARVNGNLPSAASPGVLSRIPSVTWRQVNDAGTRGTHGLAEGRTLHHILAPLRHISEDHLRQEARTIFSEHGKFPTGRSHELIPGLFGQTWRSIDALSLKGGRGLAQGRTVSKILAPLRAELKKTAVKKQRPLLLKPVLTECALLAAAREHFSNYWEIPTRRSKEPIPLLPGESWLAIDQAGFQGHRGLMKGRTLAVIFAPLREELRIGIPLSKEMIIAEARAVHALHGVLPTRRTTLPLPTLHTTWEAINVALQRGLRGLPGGNSLSKLLQPLRAELGLDQTLSEPAILAAARTFHHEHGRLPSQLTTDPVPGMPGESWSKIHGAGQLGLRGLQKGRTLSKILHPLREELRFARRRKIHSQE